MTGFASSLWRVRPLRVIDHSSAARSMRDPEAVSATEMRPRVPSSAFACAFSNSNVCAEERRQEIEKRKIKANQYRAARHIRVLVETVESLTSTKNTWRAFLRARN